MIVGALLLTTIISVCTAQNTDGVGETQRKLDQCKNTEKCEWRKGKIVYNVDKAERTERDLYYTESYKIRANGKITFKISEHKRVYVHQSQYSNYKLIEKLFPYGSHEDTAPIIVNGKVKISKFQSVHEDSRISRRIFRKLDSEYSCQGFGRFDENTCTVEVYLMTFSMPYQVRSANKNKTCECTDDGIYTVTNIPDVILTTESERIV